MILRCCDVETTGLDPAKDGAAVCELGICDVRWKPILQPSDNSEGLKAVGGEWHICPPQSVFVDPGHAIPPAMSGIHHITDDMVAGAYKWSIASMPLLAEAGKVTLCAHNNRFEMKFITTPAPWIDTYRVALAHAPKAPDHKLQTLRYWLKLRLDEDYLKDLPPGRQAHSAGFDAYCTALLVHRMLSKLSIEEMKSVSSRPALLTKFTFGKHAMEEIGPQIPDRYLQWIIDNIDDSEDVIHTARHHLAMRNPQRNFGV